MSSTRQNLTVADQVFVLQEHGQPIWKAIVGGVVVPAEWPDKGSALAGMQTEQRRRKQQHD